jgi:hypothetical protein
MHNYLLQFETKTNNKFFPWFMWIRSYECRLYSHDSWHERSNKEERTINFGSSVESPSSETEEKEDSNLVVSQCNNFFCSCEKSIIFHTKNNFVKTKDIECILWCSEDIVMIPILTHILYNQIFHVIYLSHGKSMLTFIFLIFI